MSYKYPDMIGKPFNDPFEIFVFHKKDKSLKIQKYDKNIISENELDDFGPSSAYCNGNNHLYISGGETKTADIGLYFWDIDLNTQGISKINMLKKKKNHSMIYIPEKKWVFIVGGNDLSTLYYNTESKEILDWSNLNKKIIEPALAVSSNYLYCFDDCKNNQDFSFEKTSLNPDDTQWHKIEPKIEPSLGIMNQKYFGLLKDSNENIIFIGGNIDGGEGFQNKNCFMYNVNNNVIESSDVPFEEYNLKEKSFLPYNEKIDFILPDFNRHHPQALFYQKNKKKLSLVKYEPNRENRKPKPKPKPIIDLNFNMPILSIPKMDKIVEDHNENTNINDKKEKIDIGLELPNLELNNKIQQRTKKIDINIQDNLNIEEEQKKNEELKDVNINIDTNMKLGTQNVPLFGNNITEGGNNEFDNNLKFGEKILDNKSGNNKFKLDINEEIPVPDIKIDINNNNQNNQNEDKPINGVVNIKNPEINIDKGIEDLNPNIKVDLNLNPLRATSLDGNLNLKEIEKNNPFNENIGNVNPELPNVNISKSNIDFGERIIKINEKTDNNGNYEMIGIIKGWKDNQITVPGVEINGPNINMPTVDLNMPSGNIMPGININGPNLEGKTSGVNIEGPKLEGKMPGINIEGPKLDGKMPGININGPNLEGKMPGVNIEVPKLDGNMPGMNIEGPNFEGKIPGMNIDGPKIDTNLNVPNLGFTANVNGPQIDDGQNYFYSGIIEGKKKFNVNLGGQMPEVNMNTNLDGINVNPPNINMPSTNINANIPELNPTGDININAQKIEIPNPSINVEGNPLNIQNNGDLKLGGNLGGDINIEGPKVNLEGAIPDLNNNFNIEGNMPNIQMNQPNLGLNSNININGPQIGDNSAGYDFFISGIIPSKNDTNRKIQITQSTVPDIPVTVQMPNLNVNTNLNVQNNLGNMNPIPENIGENNELNVNINGPRILVNNDNEMLQNEQNDIQMPKIHASNNMAMANNNNNFQIGMEADNIPF